MANKFFDFDIGFDEKPKGKKHRNNPKAKVVFATFFCENCDFETLLPIKKGKGVHICPNCKTELIRELF